jgi:hypothetical protein
VIAAEQYASRLVVPQSQQHSAMRWPSHRDHARKALAKLAGPHLPATLKQVEKAVAKAHSKHEKAASGRTTTSRAAGGNGEQLLACGEEGFEPSNGLKPSSAAFEGAPQATAAQRLGHTSLGPAGLAPCAPTELHTAPPTDPGSADPEPTKPCAGLERSRDNVSHRPRFLTGLRRWRWSRCRSR